MSLWIILLAVLAFTIPATIVFTAGMTVTRRLWLANPLVGPLYGILVLALVSWLAFLAYWIAPAVGVVFGSAALVAALVAFVQGGLWREWRQALPTGALVVGAIVFYLGFTYLWGTDGGVYDVVPTRFFHFRMPADNLLPGIFGQHIVAGQPTHALLGDWNGGDRPPLQSGFGLLMRPIVGLAQLLTGHSPVEEIPEATSFAFDMLPQLLWVPAGYALLRMLSFRRWTAVGGLVFALIIPTVMVNTVFTWPKMLSAALVLAALAFLLAAKKTPERFAVYFGSAILAAVFAVLAHGAAAFTIPVLLIVGVYALRGRPLRRSLAGIGIAIGAGLVLYAPWIYYQRFVDPPGDRLLKWHLAGITQIDPRSFLQAFVDQYSSLTFSQFLANRLQNLSTLFGSDRFAQFSDPKADLTVVFRVEDWTSTMFAIGIIATVLLTMAVVSLAGRWRSLSTSERPRLVLLGGMLASVVIWVLVLFTPNQAIVPHGSHAWILVLTMVPFAWLLEWAPRTGVVLLCVQAAFGVTLYFRDLYDPTSRFSPSAALVSFVGLLFLLVVPLLLARRGERMSSPDELAGTRRAARAPAR
jgi:hypothetical protein